ncbi:MAG: SsrA-binding protein SmpB [Candidatus Omnitrophica bacterium]|nr:SsrA-binding protein SmpB [Candidatus Omnitrophota bacterium]
MNDHVIADNRKARHDYFLFDKLEAGIELKGSEVKSIRDGRVNLRDAYVRVNQGEVFVVNLHIATYRYTHHFVPEPTRTRKLLLKKKEIEHLIVDLTRKSFVCVPLRLYFKRNFIKLEIALAKKKKAHDKRQTLKEEIHRKEMDKAVKQSLRRKIR